MKFKDSKKHGLAHKHRHFLALLCSMRRSLAKRNILLDSADPEHIYAICDCVYNVLKGNVKVKKHEFIKLKKYKDTLRLIVKPNLSLKKRRQTIKQKGGFLPLILPMIASLISTVLPKIL